MQRAAPQRRNNDPRRSNIFRLSAYPLLCAGPVSSRSRSQPYRELQLRPELNTDGSRYYFHALDIRTVAVDAHRRVRKGGQRRPYHVDDVEVVIRRRLLILLHFTGPPAPITARVRRRLLYEQRGGTHLRHRGLEVAKVVRVREPPPCGGGGGGGRARPGAVVAADAQEVDTLAGAQDERRQLRADEGRHHVRLQLVPPPPQ
eukprot:6610894-Pyramimonas_sp.AAC.1